MSDKKAAGALALMVGAMMAPVLPIRSDWFAGKAKSISRRERARRRKRAKIATKSRRKNR